VQAVDLYCERLGPGLLAEPLNALSNLAFLLGALLLLRSRAVRRNQAARLPAVLLANVGLGSLVFHTWATQVGMVLDVAPILLLIAWAGREALLRELGWNLSRIALVALALLVGTLPLWFWVADPAAAGIAYVPAGVLLWAVWTRFHARGHHGASQLLVASIAFTFAYTARALDGVLCAWIPMGTHWIWHLFNALSMTALIAGLTPATPPLRHPPSTEPGA
jgi:hypothetical protein